MKEKLQEMSRKILVYCAGLLVMAMGASFSGKAGLAISMALIALGISLACFGQFHGIREGTLIAARRARPAGAYLLWGIRPVR